MLTCHPGPETKVQLGVTLISMALHVYLVKLTHRLVLYLSTQQDLDRLEMVFSEEKVGSGGGGLMKLAATGGSEFGLLTEPSVVLHAMNSSE